MPGGVGSFQGVRVGPGGAMLPAGSAVPAAESRKPARGGQAGRASRRAGCRLSPERLTHIVPASSGKEQTVPRPRPGAPAPLPSWIVLGGSIAVAAHLGVLVLLALGAPSGPWPTPFGSSTATAPQFAQTLGA